MSTTFPYLNVHVLRPAAAANPNRDDQGAPKTVTYGGTTRARLSSASQNRAARVDFEQNSPADRTVRSAHTARRLAEQIAGTDTPSDELVDYLTRSINGLTAKAETTDAKDTLVWLEQAKIDQLAADAAANIAAGGDTPLNFDDLTQTTALAVAAFGRMFAARPDLQLEAAVSVAHAITTHTAATEIDYFTAVDDDPTSTTSSPPFASSPAPTPFESALMLAAELGDAGSELCAPPANTGLALVQETSPAEERLRVLERQIGDTSRVCAQLREVVVTTRGVTPSGS